MKFFPFQNLIFKTSLSRAEIADVLRGFTFLSDEGYRKDQNQKLFFGEVSANDFSLELVAEQTGFTPYIEGTQRGVDREMFVFVRLGEFRHRRYFVLLLLLLLSGLAYLISDLLTVGIGLFSLSHPGPVVFLGLLIGIASWMFYVSGRFYQKTNGTIDFLKQQLAAETITRNEVPLIFRSGF